MAEAKATDDDFPTDGEIRQTVGEAKKLVNLLNAEIEMTLQYLEENVGKDFDDYHELQRARNLLVQEAKSEIENFINEAPNMEDSEEYDDAVDEMFHYITYKTFYDRLHKFMKQCVDHAGKDLQNYVLDETSGVKTLPKPLVTLKATAAQQFKDLKTYLEKSRGVGKDVTKGAPTVRPDIKRFFGTLLALNEKIKMFYYKHCGVIEVTHLEAFLNKELVTRSFLSTKDRSPAKLSQSHTTFPKKRSPSKSDEVSVTTEPTPHSPKAVQSTSTAVASTSRNLPREIRQAVGEAKQLVNRMNAEIEMTLQYLEDNVGKEFDDYHELQRARNLLVQEAKSEIENFINDASNMEDSEEYDDAVDEMFHYITYKTFYDRLHKFMKQCVDHAGKDLQNYVLDETSGVKNLEKPLVTLKATAAEQFKDLKAYLEKSRGIDKDVTKGAPTVRPDIKRFFGTLLALNEKIKMFYYKYCGVVEVTRLEAFLNKELVTRLFLNTKDRSPAKLSQGHTTFQKKRSPSKSDEVSVTTEPTPHSPKAVQSTSTTVASTSRNLPSEVQQTLNEARELVRWLDAEMVLDLKYIEKCVGNTFRDYPGLWTARKSFLHHSEFEIEHFLKEIPNYGERRNYDDIVQLMLHNLTYRRPKIFYDRLDTFMNSCAEHVREDLHKNVLDQTKGVRNLAPNLASLKTKTMEQFQVLLECLESSRVLAEKVTIGEPVVCPDIKKFFDILLEVNKDIKTFVHKQRGSFITSKLEAFLKTELVSRSALTAQTRVSRPPSRVTKPELLPAASRRPPASQQPRAKSPAAVSRKPPVPRFPRPAGKAPVEKSPKARTRKPPVPRFSRPPAKSPTRKSPPARTKKPPVPRFSRAEQKVTKPPWVDAWHPSPREDNSLTEAKPGASLWRISPPRAKSPPRPPRGRPTAVLSRTFVVEPEQPPPETSYIDNVNEYEHIEEYEPIRKTTDRQITHQQIVEPARTPRRSWTDSNPYSFEGFQWDMQEMEEKPMDVAELSVFHEDDTYCEAVREAWNVLTDHISKGQLPHALPGVESRLFRASQLSSIGNASPPPMLDDSALGGEVFFGSPPRHSHLRILHSTPTRSHVEPQHPHRLDLHQRIYHSTPTEAHVVPFVFPEVTGSGTQLYILPSGTALTADRSGHGINVVQNSEPTG